MHVNRLIFQSALLVFTLGHRFAGNDFVSINLDRSGIVTVTNNELKIGKTCVIYIDQNALGEEFGKEVRKFILGSNFERCVVVEKANYETMPGVTIGHADLIMLSGITVEQVEIMKGSSKYVLLNPAFWPSNMPRESIQAIVFPEVNRFHCFEPEAALLDKFQSKIRRVPFNESFEISWSEYCTDELECFFRQNEQD